MNHIVMYVLHAVDGDMTWWHPPHIPLHIILLLRVIVIPASRESSALRSPVNADTNARLYPPMWKPTFIRRNISYISQIFIPNGPDATAPAPAHFQNKDEGFDATTHLRLSIHITDGIARLSLASKCANSFAGDMKMDALGTVQPYMSRAPNWESTSLCSGIRPVKLAHRRVI